MSVLRRPALIVALLWTIGVGLFMAFGPVYQTETESASVNFDDPSSATRTMHSGTASGFAVNGFTMVLPVVVPLLLALAPLLVARRKQQRTAGVAAVVMLAFCVIGAFSVGPFYVPAAIALAIAAAVPDRPA